MNNSQNREKQKRGNRRAVTAPSQRPKNKGNIYLRKLHRFHNSSSLGIIIPAGFIEKLGLQAEELVKLELNEKHNSITLQRIEVG